MMKRICLFVISVLIIFCNCTFGQIRVTGKVINLEEDGIPGATVTLSSNVEQEGVVTGQGGVFEIILNNPGSFQLEVRFLGYETFRRTYTFEENKNYDLQNIKLLDSKLQLQSIEVTGRLQKDYISDYSFSATKIGIENKLLPQSLTAVTKELIEDRQVFQLADAVKIVSGVAPSSYYNQYNIRGISQNEEGQIINGMRTRQYYFLQPIIDHIERIEVLKGPASVTFSSVDPGGSINLVTKKPLSEDRRQIRLSVGSFSTFRGAMDFTGPLNKSKTLLYRINTAVQQAQSFRDLVQNNAFLISPSFSYIPDDKTAVNVEMIYSNGTGTLDRGQAIFGATAGITDLNSTPLSLNLGATNDYFKSIEFILMTNLSHRFSDRISFNTSYMKQTWTEDLQEHRTVNAFAVDINNQPITNQVAMRFIQRQQFWDNDVLNSYINFDVPIGKVSNKFLIGYDLSRWHKTRGGGQNSARGYLPNDGTVPRSFDPDSASQYQTIEVNGILAPKPNVEHFNLSNPSYTIKNSEDYIMDSRIAVPSALTTTHAIYIQEQLQIGRFHALLNLRKEWYEDITNFEAPGEASFKNTAFIPRVGLTFELTDDLNLYATYLEGFQPQSNTVTLMPSTGAFFWDPNSPARFDPLISDLKEVGLKGTFFNESLSVTMAAYEINQKNILINANLPAYPDSLVQRGADRSRGLEWDISGFILPDWQVNLSYSYINAKIVQDQDESLNGERKENTPEHSGNLWTRYSFNEKSKFKNLGIGLGVQYSGDKVPWFTRDFILPGYTLFDMAIYYNPLKANMELVLKINNLFDETYWIGAQNYLRLFPGSPRNIMLTANYKF